MDKHDKASSHAASKALESLPRTKAALLGSMAMQPSDSDPDDDAEMSDPTYTPEPDSAPIPAPAYTARDSAAAPAAPTNSQRAESPGARALATAYDRKAATWRVEHPHSPAPPPGQPTSISAANTSSGDPAVDGGGEPSAKQRQQQRDYSKQEQQSVSTRAPAEAKDDSDEAKQADRRASPAAHRHKSITPHPVDSSAGPLHRHDALGRPQRPRGADAAVTPRASAPGFLECAREGWGDEDDDDVHHHWPYGADADAIAAPAEAPRRRVLIWSAPARDIADRAPLRASTTAISDLSVASLPLPRDADWLSPAAQPAQQQYPTTSPLAWPSPSSYADLRAPAAISLPPAHAMQALHLYAAPAQTMHPEASAPVSLPISTAAPALSPITLAPAPETEEDEAETAHEVQAFVDAHVMDFEEEETERQVQDFVAQHIEPFEDEETDRQVQAFVEAHTQDFDEEETERGVRAFVEGHTEDFNEEETERQVQDFVAQHVEPYEEEQTEKQVKGFIDAHTADFRAEGLDRASARPLGVLGARITQYRGRDAGPLKLAEKVWNAEVEDAEEGKFKTKKNYSENKKNIAGPKETHKQLFTHFFLQS